MNIAYVAGFFDGEGCVNFASCRKSLFPRVLITNTDIDILQRIQKRFGGDINPLSLRKENWKQGYSLRISWSKAVEFLSEIYPYLFVKAAQAETVFAWDAIRLGSGKKTLQQKEDYKDSCDLLYRRMRWLNQKGNKDTVDPIDEEIALSTARRARKGKR